MVSLFRHSLGESQHTGRSLRHGNVKIAGSEARHRPAQDQFRQFFRNNAGLLQKEAHSRSDLDEVVARTRHRVAGNSHNSLHERQPGVESIDKRAGRSDVIDRRAHRRRKSARRHFLSGQRVDQLFFAALRITRPKRLYENAGIGAAR